MGTDKVTENTVQKTRATDEDGKVQRAESTPDKNEIICPLILLVTKGQSAVNYDITWTSTMDLGSGPGVWRSAPQQRGHADAFYKKLGEMRAANQIGWDEKAYYFTHAQGVEARETYQRLVLGGRVKANKRSWENRFEKFTNTTFAQLVEKYPDMYKSPAKAAPAPAGEKSEEKEVIQASSDAIDFSGLTDESGEIDTPTEEVTEQTVASSEDAVEEPPVEELEEIEQVAAVTAPELDLSNLTDPDAEDHTKCRVFADSSKTPIDVDTESIEWRGSDGENHQAFLIELPNDDLEMWLEADKSYDINGITYIVEVGE